MAVFGIIAEYNPFHNGHKYQIDAIKSSGEHTVVVVMSPNVVQRGDFAILDKWTRTRAALLNGADLVLELPSPFALATAEKFSKGATQILHNLGCVDFLCFGSESGNLEALSAAASLIDDADVMARARELLKDGITFAKARSLAVNEKSSDAAKVLETPNDILAVEYIRSLKKLGSSIKPYPILRKGSGHESKTPVDNIASASFIREAFTEDTIKSFTPESELYLSEIKAGNVSEGIDSLSSALLLKLRLMTSEQIANLPDVSEGLENRILRAAKEAKSLDELCSILKTKRYTLSRIRRILMYALLSFSKQNDIENVPYIRVLGHNQKGLEIISRKTAQIPVITSLARAREISKEAELLSKIEENCTAAFELTLKSKTAKNEFTTQPIRI